MDNTTKNNLMEAAEHLLSLKDPRVLSAVRTVVAAVELAEADAGIEQTLQDLNKPIGPLRSVSYSNPWTSDQRKEIFGLLTDAGEILGIQLTSKYARVERLALAAGILGSEVDSFTHFTEGVASDLIRGLRCMVEN